MTKEGIPWVLAPLLGAAAAGYFGLWYFAIPLLVLAAFMAYFFRDPERSITKDPLHVVSPADGRVTRIEKNLDEAQTERTLISIFLSPFDVHINRAPIAGEVISVNYTKGSFMIATKDEASLVNERNSITIRGERMTVVCRQIAGVLARRIVCWKRAGDSLEIGERFGLIKFGSRTDVIFPREVEVLVKVGERVKGGSTVLGRLRDGG